MISKNILTNISFYYFFIFHWSKIFSIGPSKMAKIGPNTSAIFMFIGHKHVNIQTYKHTNIQTVWALKKGVGYFLKGFLSKTTFQETIFQAAKVSLGPLRRRSSGCNGGRTLGLWWARGPSAAARTSWGLQLGQIWEVDTWEKSYRKVPNILKERGPFW